LYEEKNKTNINIGRNKNRDGIIFICITNLQVLRLVLAETDLEMQHTAGHKLKDLETKSTYESS
jgi:hypothetical protein